MTRKNDSLDSVALFYKGGKSETKHRKNTKRNIHLAPSCPKIIWTLTGGSEKFTQIHDMST